jgi:hypothetical protein
VEAECRVVWLPVWCGNYVEAVLCVSVGVMVCGAMGLCVCLACGVVSLGSNSIGDEGVAAIGAGLVHVPSLTTLEYVRTRRLFWVEGGSVTGLCRWVW